MTNLSDADADAARIARRYPPARTPRWLWLPVAIVAGSLLVVWTVWSGLHHANPPAVAHIVSFKVVSDTQIDALVTVQRTDVRSRVECQASSQAISYDTVGQLPFTWEPNGEELQTDWISVKTFKKPVTVQIDWCKVVG